MYLTMVPWPSLVIRMMVNLVESPSLPSSCFSSCSVPLDFMATSDEVTVPEYEHSAILFWRRLSDTEAKSMITKLKGPLAYYLDIPEDAITLDHENSQCVDYNGT